MPSILPPPIIKQTARRQNLLVALFLGLSFLLQAATAQVLNPDSTATEAGETAPTSTTSIEDDNNTNNDIVTAQNTIKFLVCGDSITQGAEGDFTWRYRLWEWFRANAQLAMTTPTSAGTSGSTTTRTTTTKTTYLTPTLQYVGPYNGTLPASVADDIDLADPQTWGPYHPSVDPAFSPGGGSAHFAVYGRPAWMDVDLLREQVARHGPDVVVLHLGFNDFGWWGQTAAELVESVRKLVAEARRGSAGGRVGILIADVSHRLLVQGREDIPVTTDEYNALLKQKALGWSTVESPVTVVKVSEDYDCHVESCPAGIDGLHPNALGDYQIARAYTKVLHDKYHFGAEPLVVPNLETIPGFEVFGGSSNIGGVGGLTTDAFMHPPIGIFVVLSVLCLIVAVVLRPRLMKALRHGGGWYGGKYQLLPTARDAS